jgi:hypothetical protein
MKRITRSALALGAIMSLTLAFVPSASAETYLYMKPSWLEQAVLRAQPGTALGNWTQNFYYTNKGLPAADLSPVVCPTMTKKKVTLPKADSYGAVGYAVSQDISLAITIWQYKSEADAQLALTQFLDASCPDAPRIPWEDDKFYAMKSGGGDYTSSEIKGVPAYLKGYEGTVENGLAIDVTWAVRPVGKAIIRVEAEMFDNAAKSPTKMKAAPRLISNWIDAASKAVLKFSSNDPNAA